MDFSWLVVSTWAKDIRNLFWSSDIGGTNEEKHSVLFGSCALCAHASATAHSTCRPSKETTSSTTNHFWKMIPQDTYQIPSFGKIGTAAGHGAIPCLGFVGRQISITWAWRQLHSETRPGWSVFFGIAVDSGTHTFVQRIPTEPCSITQCMHQSIALYLRRTAATPYMQCRRFSFWAISWPPLPLHQAFFFRKTWHQPAPIGLESIHLTILLVFDVLCLESWYFRPCWCHCRSQAPCKKMVGCFASHFQKKKNCMYVYIYI